MDRDFWRRRERLEELAQRATPGEWQCPPYSESMVVSREGRLISSSRHCSFNRKFGLLDMASAADNAAYIAAANPAMILELCAEMRRLEKALEDKEARIGNYIKE